MMSRHFRLSSELTGAIAKRLPHVKNQPSASGSFFNQFVTDIYIYIYIYIQSSSFNSKDIYIYIYIYICNELIEETGGHRRLIFGMWESFGYGSSKF